jgi:hypothetical protein
MISNNISINEAVNNLKNPNKEAFENLALEKLPPLFQDVWAPDIYRRIRNVN